jgi:iron complex transport system permease protein
MAGHERERGARTGVLGLPVRSATFAWCVALSALLCVTVVLSAGLGPTEAGYVTVLAVVADSVTQRVPFVEGTTFYGGKELYKIVVMDVRLPRVAVAVVVGFALGAAGAVMQGFFRNPMAEPTVIGVSSGAAVGAVAVIVYSLSVSVQTAAFAGALLAAGLVYGLATKNGRTGVATLLLAGIAVQMFLSAIVSYMMHVSDDQGLRAAVYWLMGSLLHKAWSDVAVTAPTVFVGFGVLMFYASDLNVLLLGEEEARTLGVEPRRTKMVLLAVSSIMTAAAVAVAGVIGFVGLIVPHAMRLVVGPDHRVLIPTSALGGAIFLVAADAVARVAMGGEALPVGIVTSLVGVPFFLYLLRNREVHDL